MAVNSAKESKNLTQDKEIHSSSNFGFIECKGDNKVNNPNKVNDFFNFQNFLFGQNNLNYSLINPYLSFSPPKIQNIFTGNDKPSSKPLLNKKRNLEKLYKEILDNIMNKKENEKKIDNIDMDNNNNKTTRGRRSKNKLYDTVAEHNKFREDNIVRKIKTFIFKYILDHLNKSLENKNYKFYPLNTHLNENLKKDFNERLLNMTICDIYSNFDLNNRYKNLETLNKNLIKKIYEENVEKKAINILNMKYIDIVNHIREKDLENFLETIKEKEKKKQEKNIDSYMEEINKMLYEYENWFKIKHGRNKSQK